MSYHRTQVSLPAMDLEAMREGLEKAGRNLSHFFAELARQMEARGRYVRLSMDPGWHGPARPWLVAREGIREARLEADGQVRHGRVKAARDEARMWMKRYIRSLP